MFTKFSSKVSKAVTVECSTCNGKGWYLDDRCDGVTCEDCRGKGYNYDW